MTRKDKRDIIAELSVDYQVVKQCPDCKITVSDMIVNPDRMTHFLCPRCGHQEPIFGTKGTVALRDMDAGDPLLEVMDKNLKPASLEEREALDLRKRGAGNVRVWRL